MPRKKIYDAVFVQRGRVWYAWANEPVGAIAQGRTKEEAQERLIQEMAELLYPGSKGATSRTVDFRLREKLVLARRDK
jgi:hypothetical protein